MGRKLVYVPIVHQEVDLGSLSGELQKAYIARYGLKKWRQHLRAVDDLWQQIRRRIFNLGLDFARVKLYQDGLPAAGDLLQIIRTSADRRSQNYQLLVDLLAAGSQVVGTEDPNLLLEEYHRLINGLGSGRHQSERSETRNPESDREKPATSDQQPAIGYEDWLMTERDKFIARRIDETLQNGETGILFIGAKHRVLERLPRDIEASYLLPEFQRE